MKVIVFGATGSVGALVTAELLEAGHKVTAFARSPKQLELASPALTLMAGDAMNAEVVAEAVNGQDAVVIALGAGMNRSSKIRSIGTLNIIQGMQAHGVKRLICQSTLGAHESWENLNFFWKRIMFGVLLRPVFKDHQRQEDMVRASGLDWTIVRPSAFDDASPRGRFREDFDATERGLTLKITRADIAAFLARHVGSGTYLRRAVAISN